MPAFTAGARGRLAPPGIFALHRRRCGLEHPCPPLGFGERLAQAGHLGLQPRDGRLAVLGPAFGAGKQLAKVRYLGLGPLGGRFPVSGPPFGILAQLGALGHHRFRCLCAREQRCGLFLQCGQLGDGGGALQLLKRDELGGDRLHLLARRRVMVGSAHQLVDRADQRLAGLADPRIIMAQLAIDDAGDCQIEVEFGFVGNPEKIAQLRQIARRLVEPGFVFDRANIGRFRVAEKIGRIGEPAILASVEAESVAHVERAGDLSRVAEAIDDLGGELQLVHDLAPHWHQPHRARVLEAEGSVANPPFEKRGDLAPHARDPRLRPPGDRQRQIVGQAEIRLAVRPRWPQRTVQ